MADELKFDRAEFSEGASAGACVACGKALDGEYYSANGKVCCPACRAGIVAPPDPGGGPARFIKALFLGALGGAIGATIWWAVMRFANLELGLIAILVGFLVGGGVRMGAERVGGVPYQIIAVVLTYLSVAAAYTPFVVDAWQKDAGDLPFLLLLVRAFVQALAVPFLGGFENIIGIIIILIALWQAWRMNARPKIEWSGPHRVAVEGAVPAVESPSTLPPPLPPPVA